VSSKNLVICDREREFAVRLADYLGRRKELALQVKLCDCPEQIEAIRRETEVDILLADERIEFTEGELSGYQTIPVHSLPNPKSPRHRYCDSRFPQTATSTQTP